MDVFKEVEQIRGAVGLIDRQLRELKKVRVGEKKRKRDLEQARALVSKVAQEVQSTLEYQVSELASLAIASVFEDDPYRLQLDFVERRNRTEVDIFFAREGEEPVSPMDASGGGAVDLASFALRVSLYVLCRPRSRNVLFFDEPFRNLSRDLMPKASEIVKEISRRVGVQIVIVTHDPSLTKSADRVFHVELDNRRISQVSVVEQEEEE